MDRPRPRTGVPEGWTRNHCSGELCGTGTTPEGPRNSLEEQIPSLDRSWRVFVLPGVWLRLKGLLLSGHFVLSRSPVSEASGGN